MLVGILTFIAMGLTCTMFATRQMMLGFACVMFWAILGAYAYTLSTTPWGDIWFYMFFACAFGMTTFCAIAMYGLRERRDTIADEDMELGEGGLIGEGEAEMGDEVLPGENKPSARQRIRERVRNRKEAQRGRWRG